MFLNTLDFVSLLGVFRAEMITFYFGYGIQYEMNFILVKRKNKKKQISQTHDFKNSKKKNKTKLK